MRKTLFKWHSISALLAMLPLMIIAITGSILVFKVEIDTWLMPQHMTVTTTANQQRKRIDDLIERVESQHSNFVLGSWEIFDDKKRSDAAYLIHKQEQEWYKLYIDQYSGQLLSQPVSITHYLTDWLLSLHYTFLLGLTGTLLGFFFALALLFLSISGIILHRQFWKKLFTLRLTAAKRIFFSDVHKLIGIMSAPVLLIMAFTGAYWNISEVIHEALEHGDDHAYVTEKIYDSSLNFQSLLDTSEQHIAGHRPTYLTFPFEPDRHIHLFGDVPNKPFLSSEYSSVVTYDKHSGKVLNTFDIRRADTWPMIVDMFRKLHFGYFAGTISKIIWCVLGLSPLWLAMTGLYFYLFRTKAKRKKREVLRQVTV